MTKFIVKHNIGVFSTNVEIFPGNKKPKDYYFHNLHVHHYIVNGIDEANKLKTKLKG